MEQWRVFLGLWLPPVLLEPLMAVQTELRSHDLAIRWTKHENLHITLHFLGNIPVASLPALQAAFAHQIAGILAPSLQFDHLGAFPKPRQPSVVWAGFSAANQRLEALHQAAVSAGQQIGIPPEQRPYHPHVTLGYVHRDATPQERKACAQAILMDWKGSPSAVAPRVAIIRSEMQPAGARYTSIAEWSLEHGS